MRFPLAEWIDRHPGCRFDLATSGMRGSLRPLPWPAQAPGRERIEELRSALAAHLGVARRRVFLSHGASEANSWVLAFLARLTAGRAPLLRVEPPEYPPLPDAAARWGFRVRHDARPADVAVVSRPRNPGGDLWSVPRLEGWAGGARQLVVDETFREFADVPSLAREGRARLWTTGTFTKFYGADAARVGFAVAPPEAAAAFEHHVGLISDELAPGSAAIALGLLRDFPRVRKEVRAVVDANLRAFARALPGTALPRAPVFFDRPVPGGGDRIATRCLRASVLVCPGRLFGAPTGVRVCLTRRNFPAGLRAYLRVRAGAGTAA